MAEPESPYVVVAIGNTITMNVFVCTEDSPRAMIPVFGLGTTVLITAIARRGSET